MTERKACRWTCSDSAATSANGDDASVVVLKLPRCFAVIVLLLFLLPDSEEPPTAISTARVTQNHSFFFSPLFSIDWLKKEANEKKNQNSPKITAINRFFIHGHLNFMSIECWRRCKQFTGNNILLSFCLVMDCCNSFLELLERQKSTTSHNGDLMASLFEIRNPKERERNNNERNVQ